MPRRKSVKYLGVILDEVLSFSDHIQCVTSKDARNIGVIRKMKHFFPQLVLRLLCCSLVHPYLLYYCSVWSSTFAVHLKPLRMLQNAVIRILNGCDSRFSVTSAYIKIRIMPLGGQFIFYRCQFMFDLLYYLAPDCFGNNFITVSQSHNYNVRIFAEFRKRPKKSTRSGFPMRQVLPVVWNMIPVSLSEETERPAFRELLRNHCLGCYEF